MIKYVYILVSDETDYYLEEALISLTSLRMHIPTGSVSLLIDSITEKNLTGKRKNIFGLVNEVKVADIEPRFNKKARSRWLKTSMRRYITGNFLYIDCDTVICENLSDIEDLGCDLGAVLNGHILQNGAEVKKNQANDNKIVGFDVSSINKYFNGGVILCRDIPKCHEFFDEWHKLWLYCFERGILIDQASFNKVNFNLGNIITEMDGKWNCQINGGGIAFLVNAKIIHYLTSLARKKNPYLLSDFDLLQKVKESGVIDDKLKEYLLHPKTIFSLNTRLETRRVREIIQDTFLQYIREYKKNVRL